MTTELTKKELYRRDFYSWITNEYYLPNGKKYSFEGHEYLEQIAKRHWDIKDQVYIMKSAQCGATELAWGWTMWMAERGLPDWQGQGFCFPATEQMRDHIKSRINPILELPKFAPKVSLHNLRMIKYNNVPINFRAAQTRRDMISWSADAIMMDEFDEWADPLGAVKTVEARLGHSKYKWIWAQSTPKYPDIGIDAAFALSNQHHWFLKCDHCKESFSPLMEVMASSFESCVLRGEDGVVGFSCPHCEKLTQTSGAKGEWRLMAKGKKHKHGYSISKLFVGHANLEELLETYEDSHNIAEFYNSDLGLPYSPANSRLSRSDITDNATGDEKCARGSAEPTIAGIDVGKKCNYMIALPTENNQLNVIAYGTCTFDDLPDLLRRFNVDTLCIDLRPEEQSVKHLITGKRRWYASDYNASGSIDWWQIVRADSGKAGSIKVIKNHRTQTCDALIESIAIKKMFTFPQVAKYDNTLIKQMCAMQRMEKTENDTGELKAFYGNGGRADHYFHAGAFLYLAFLAGRKRGITSAGPQFH